MTRFALPLLLGWLLASCATTSPQPGSSRVVLLDIQGSLALSDGTPVASADLAIRCGAVEQAARTDEKGRFVLRRLPEGDCLLVCPAARLAKTRAPMEEARRR